MFTGIVEEVGCISFIRNSGRGARIGISGKKIFEQLEIGDSVAVNGVCLTASAINGTVFEADIMNETLERSTLRHAKSRQLVNLERAMAANGRFGGHIVSGHIDGTGKIVSIERDSIALWFQIEAPQEVMKYIILKGSVTIDGISLTVAKVNDKAFSVSVIPHTAEETILGNKQVGELVNLENDVIGKYVEKLLNFGGNEWDGRNHKTMGKVGTKSGTGSDTRSMSRGSITVEFLAKNGF